MAVEREIKLQIGDEFALPTLDGIAGFHASDRGVHLLQATYWDTDALQLMRSGHGLRHRTKDGGSGTWTLKGATRVDGDAVVRDEFELPGSPEVIPDEIIERVRRVVDPRALHPVARLRTERHIVELATREDAEIEVAEDTVQVLEGTREVARFREVEAEMRIDVPAARIEAVLARIREAGAAAPAPSSKYRRALLALGYDVTVPGSG